MDALLNASLDAIALAPNRGLAVSDLWARLATTATTDPAVAAIPLTPTIRNALWSLIVGYLDDNLEFCLPSTSSSSKSQDFKVLRSNAPEIASLQAAEAAGVLICASSALQDTAIGIVGARLSRHSISNTQRDTLRFLCAAKERGILQSSLTAALKVDPRNYHYVVKNLEERGLIVRYPAVIRTTTLPSASSTNLVLLTKFGPHGIPIGKESQARLSDGHASTFKGRAGLLLLAPDMPAMGPSPSTTTVGKDNTEAPDDLPKKDAFYLPGYKDLTDSTMTAPKSAGGLQVVTDDDSQLRRISEKLESLENHTAKEGELKKVLGFTTTAGHRLWRRFRSLLVKKGVIETFAGVDSASDKQASFVKLLKPWTADGDGDDDWAIADLVDASGRLVIFSEQCAEVSMDRQLLRSLMAAREEGITTLKLESMYKMGIKRHDLRIRELKTRLGPDALIEQHVNQGRTRMNRFSIAPHVLLALKGLKLSMEDTRCLTDTQPPEGGWLAAVETAIAAGLNEDGSHPGATFLDGVPPISGAVTVHEHKTTAGQVSAHENETDVPGPSVADDATDQKETTTPVVTEGHTLSPGKQQRTSPDGQKTKLGRKRHAIDLGEEIENLHLKKPRRHKKLPTTEISKMRHQWLVDKVKADGLMLTFEVARFLQMAEREFTGNEKAVKPDRKVYQRVIDRAVAAGEMVVMHVSLPGVHGSTAVRVQSVLALPGAVHDAALVEAVFTRFREQQKEMRSFGRAGAYVASKRALKELRALEALPVVAVQSLKAEVEAAKAAQEGAAKSGADKKVDATFTQQVTNGLLPARMMRTRGLHELAWKIVERREGRPCTDLEPQLLKTAAKGNVYLVNTTPAEGRGADFGKGIFTGSADQLKLAITARDLWNQMTVREFLYYLGSNADESAITRYQTENKKLCELQQKDLVTLAGGLDHLERAEGHLTKGLDLLQRMGLVSAIIVFDTSLKREGRWNRNTQFAGQATAFMLCRQASYQEAAGSRSAEQHDGNGALSENKDSPDESKPSEEGGQSIQPPEGQSPPVGAQSRRIVTFDVSDPIHRASYWQGLMVLPMLTDGVDTGALADCFPFNRAPETMTERGWSGGASAFLQDDINVVRKYLERHFTPKTDSESNVVHAVVTWQDTLEMAETLGVAVAAAARAIAMHQLAAIKKSQYNEHRASQRRLGGLQGSTRPRVGGSTRRRRFSVRDTAKREIKRREDDDGSEVESIQEEEVEEDAHNGFSRAPQRKKKWHEEEDRQLLHAWARWLAYNGPDKILRWKFVKDRPKDLLPTSLRHRISVLKAHPDTGPGMLRVQELSSGVHSRRVLRGAVAEANIPSGRLEEGEETKEMDTEGKVGGPAAPKRPRVESGDPLLAVADASAELQPALPIPLLWESSEPADSDALKELVSEIEAILAVAPNRHTQSFFPGGKAAGRGRTALMQVGTFPGDFEAPFTRGPIRRTAGARIVAAMRRGAAAARAARAARAYALPSSVVASAIELIKALFLRKSQDSTALNALTSRFPMSIIKGAFAEIVRAGVLEFTAQQSLELSDQFELEIQPLLLSKTVFIEAAEKAKRLGLGEDAVRGLTALLSSPTAGTIAVGLCLHVMGACTWSLSVPRSLLMRLWCQEDERARKRASKAPAVEAAPVADAQQDNAFSADKCNDAGTTKQPEEGDDHDDGKVSKLLAGIRVNSVLRPAVAGSLSFDEYHLMTFGSTIVVSNKPRKRSDARLAGYSYQDEVLFQPALIAIDAGLRSEAEMACKMACSASMPWRVVEAVLHYVREAGEEAVTLAGAVALVRSKLGSKFGATSELVEAAMRLLCLYGLGREVFAFDDVRVIASESSVMRVAFPPPEVDSKGVLPGLQLPAQGTLQPLVDVPLRPWVDHRGNLIREAWSALLQRAVTAVMIGPGLGGDALLQSLRAVTPAAAREVVEALCEAGVLRAVKVTEPDSISPGGSVLEACFGTKEPPRYAMGETSTEQKGEHVDEYSARRMRGFAGDEEDGMWRFFVEQTKWWELDVVLPPQVMIS